MLAQGMVLMMSQLTISSSNVHHKSILRPYRVSRQFRMCSRAMLYTQISILFWIAKEFGAVETHLESIPWILCYVWRPKMKKLLTGKRFPMDTIGLASSECSSCKVAQLVEESAEQHGDNTQGRNHIMVPVPTNLIPSAIRCQVDASWHDEDTASGLRFIIYDSPAPLLGLKSVSRTLSPFLRNLRLYLGLWRLQSALPRSFTKLIAQRS